MKIYLAFIFCLAFTGYASAQPASVCRKASILLSLFEKYHYQPVKMDAKVSGEIFDDLIKTLDPKGLYFTAADIATLAPHRTQIPAQINTGSCTFIDALSKLYKRKLIFADTLVSLLCADPFTYNGNDQYHFSLLDDENIPPPATEMDLKYRWFALLRHEVLKSLVQPTAEVRNMLAADNKTILKNEPVFRKKAKDLEKARIHRILEASGGFDNFIADAFLNTIAKRFDPHSSYFTPDEQEDFMASMSRDEMSYGFYADENDKGEIEITHLVPGGNAWKSNQVNVGDVLLKMKFENKHPVDVSDMGEGEFDEMVEANNAAKTLELTVRKKNAQIRTVVLHKEKTDDDDNIVKSYILNGEKKIGYISLPSFYDEWENKNPLGCGNDVAKEITKLQAEKIDGLILDLRFNGGGSMREAINMAGIFINEGPICVVKEKTEKPTTLKDMNRGTAYDGPLLVMVNGCSASASELLSAVLQDYNRAVIVGNATYGKGTAQVTMPMDINYNPETPNLNGNSDLGYLKVTISKFYRVSKISHQNKGVQPDIFLPDLFFFSQQKESKEKYTLSNDTVQKNIYFTPLPALPIAALKAKSTQRVSESADFKNVKALNDSIHLLFQNQSVPLNIDLYKQYEKRVNAVVGKFDSVFSIKNKSYTAMNNALDNRVFKVNDFSKEMNDKLLEKIQSDIYIDESYKIISDLIHATP